MISYIYPMMEIPFDAYCKIVDHYLDSLQNYVPTKMEDDLRSGKLNAIIYWYPKLIQVLYLLSHDGNDFRGYLETLNPENLLLFEEIFEETTKKLDTLREKNIKINHLEEISVRNGKLK